MPGEIQVDSNPYSSPGFDGQFLIPSATAIGVWRLGDTLVMHRDAQMPPHCYRTNLPCDESEARVYSGSTPLVNWTSRIMFVTLAAMGAASLLRWENYPINRWCAASSLFTGVLLAWLTAPYGAKEIRIVYYHSKRSRRRRRIWLAAGVGLAICGVPLLPIADPAYLPSWLPELASAVPILLIFAGGAIIVPLLSKNFHAGELQGDYVILSGLGRNFVTNFPECTLEFRQTPGLWIRRVIQSME